MGQILLWTLMLSLTWMVCVWLFSLWAGRVCVIDAFWGPGFGVLATATVLFRREFDLVWAQQLLLACVLAWGLRLGIHLGLRIAADPHEDRRYAAMRDKYSPNFQWKSLGIVFLLQGVILWFVSLPVIHGLAATGGMVRSFLLGPGVLFWGVGVFFEAVGDWQLQRFRQDPANAGRVLDTGLWAWTRHPNYFGDFCVWWGLWLVSAACGAPLWTAISPAVMAFFLLRVSGVTLLEKDIGQRRPGYAEYVQRTSAFFPAPPRRGS